MRKSIFFLALGFLFLFPLAKADVTSNLISYYKFNSTDGNIVLDQQNNYNGTVNNSASYGTNETSGTPFYVPSFNTNLGDALNISQFSTINISSINFTNNYTISFWFYVAYTGAGAYTYIHNLNSSGSENWNIYTDAYGKFCWENNTVGICSGSVLSKDAWHFMTLVNDKTNCRTTFYYDGVNDTTQNGCFDATGNYKTVDGGTHFFTFDNFRIYDRALSSSDVSQLYSIDGFGGSCSNSTQQQYLGYLFVSSAQEGCGNLQNICGLATTSDICDYYALNTSYLTIPQQYANRTLVCPTGKLSNISSLGCFETTGNYLQFNSSLHCGSEYYYVFSAAFKIIYCVDSSCSNYVNQGGEVPVIVPISTVPNQTKASGTCFRGNGTLGTTFFQHYVCNSGAYEFVNETCSIGCLPSYGCVPQSYGTCVPNTVIGGRCNGNTASQVWCNNLGTGNFTETTMCPTNYYCSQGKCVARNEANTTIPIYNTPPSLSLNVTTWLFSSFGAAILISTMISAFVSYKLPTDEFKYKLYAFGFTFLGVITIGIAFEYIPAWLIVLPILVLVVIARKFIMSLFVSK